MGAAREFARKAICDSGLHQRWVCVIDAALRKAGPHVRAFHRVQFVFLHDATGAALLMRHKLKSTFSNVFHRVFAPVLITGMKSAGAALAIFCCAGFFAQSAAAERIKPVAYVKVCSLQGAGFYNIPGTDTCLKVGGYMRVDTFFNAPATFTQLGTYNRATNYIITRPRPVITLDARSQTAYGTLRSYARFGVNINGSGLGAVPFMDRAFIEFAGFTLGQTVSFYDILGYSPFVSYHALWTLGDTGGAGINVLAYTARLGGDVSATLSLEDPLMRRRGIYSTIAGVATNGVKGVAFPDVVGLVSLDKSWGKLAIAGALHDASAAHYIPGTPASGAPQDALGYAATFGGYIKIPDHPGDLVNFQIAWGRGAMGYVTDIGAGGTTLLRGGITTQAFVSDAVYAAGGGSIELTRGWSANAGYEHAWNPALKSSLFGGYAALDYSAAASLMLCNGANGCDASFSFYQLGTRTLWMPVANLTIGLDLVYSHFNNSTPAPALQAGRGDAAIWSGMLRVQRDFWPF